MTSFRDDLTPRHAHGQLPHSARHLLHQLQAAHPPPLPQARREEEGLHADAAKLSGHRGVDDDRGVQLPGWLEPGAGRRDALPPLIYRAAASAGRRSRTRRQSWSGGRAGRSDSPGPRRNPARSARGACPARERPPLARVVASLELNRSLGSLNSLFLSRAPLERDGGVEGHDEDRTTGRSRGSTAAGGLAPRGRRPQGWAGD